MLGFLFIRDGMDLSDLSGLLSAVLVIVAVAAAAWGGLNRENLKTVRESNKDLIERVSILEAQQTIDRADIVRLTGENEVLRSVVTGEATLVALGSAVHDVQETLNTHHSAAEQWIGTLDNHVVQLIDLAKAQGEK